MLYVRLQGGMWDGKLKLINRQGSPAFYTSSHLEFDLNYRENDGEFYL